MSNKEHQDKVPIIIDNTDKVLGWISKALELVKKYGIARILSTSLLIAMLSVFFYFLFNPNTAFEIYEIYYASDPNLLEEKRRKMILYLNAKLK
jgi:hypothetical protein